MDVTYWKAFLMRWKSASPMPLDTGERLSPSNVMKN